MVQLSNERVINTCPSAGICADLCYAKRGSYRFSNVLRAHVDNLVMVEYELPEWERRMNYELDTPRLKNAYVRIHDAGDFYSDEYLAAWLRIIRAHPDTHFYAYSKEVRRLKRMVEGTVFVGKDDTPVKLKLPPAPENFTIIYSFAGVDDRLIDRDVDRHADVYAKAEFVPANYRIQTDSDLLALDPDNHRIAIVTNNHRDVQKLQGNKSFGQIQAVRSLRLAIQRLAKRRRPAQQPPPVKGDTKSRPATVDLDVHFDHTLGLAFVPIEELKARSEAEAVATPGPADVLTSNIESLLAEAQVASSSRTPFRRRGGRSSTPPDSSVQPTIPGIEL